MRPFLEILDFDKQKLQEFVDLTNLTPDEKQPDIDKLRFVNNRVKKFPLDVIMWFSEPSAARCIGKAEFYQKNKLSIDRFLSFLEHDQYANVYLRAIYKELYPRAKQEDRANKSRISLFVKSLSLFSQVKGLYFYHCFACGDSCLSSGEGIEAKDGSKIREISACALKIACDYQEFHALEDQVVRLNNCVTHKKQGLDHSQELELIKLIVTMPLEYGTPGRIVCAIASLCLGYSCYLQHDTTRAVLFYKEAYSQALAAEKVYQESSVPLKQLYFGLPLEKRYGSKFDSFSGFQQHITSLFKSDARSLINQQNYAQQMADEINSIIKTQ